MTQQHIDKLREQFRTANRILLAVHERPDGDALGSMLGLADSLRREGKTVTTYAADAPAASFAFLPGIADVVQEVSRPFADLDLVVLLDCGDVKRTHVPFREVRDRRPVVANIDHHPTRTNVDGADVVDVNVVDTQASSTCELIYDYLQGVGADISKEAATCLLTGISTDTGNFQNLATTHTCMVAASKLLLLGANLGKIVEATYRNKSVDALKLWGRVLARLKYDRAKGIVTTAIRQRDYQELEVDPDAAEGVANFLNSLQEAKVILVLKEEADGTIRGSYRTTHSDVDVSQLAEKFGGGGHVKAAGFSVKGTLMETESGWEVVREEAGRKK
ncbi:MAG: bifunctional oligoribonuclease/PAP phosphatase NrnA [Candidatus Kerfeldbacteria bacterium]|nr:bifunctional oligoribonuclease/PAP phosphatase NrnA [Candidatus Kerfeldbacteria bacterium]